MILGIVQMRSLNDSAADHLVRLRARAASLGLLPGDEEASVHGIAPHVAFLYHGHNNRQQPAVFYSDTKDQVLAVLSDAQLPDITSSGPRSELKADLPIQWCVPGRWFSIATSPNDAEETLFSTDPLGAYWIYFSHLGENAHVFSDNYSIVCALTSTPSQLSSDAMFRALVLGYDLGNSTLHPDINLAPPGCVFRPTEGNEFATIRTHRLSYSDDAVGLPFDQKLERANVAFGAAARDWAQQLPTDTLISLSAGLDCRTALAHFLEQGTQLSAVNFGHPESAEARGASDTADRANMQITHFPIPPVSWGDWGDNTRALGAAGPIQNSGWILQWVDYVSSRSSAVIHGYLGDALTGKHLPRDTSTSIDWVKYWTTFSIDPEWSRNPWLRPTWRDTLHSRVEHDLRSEIKGLVTPQPFQQALHLDLYTRQRRWVASQVNELGRAVLPVSFFYHPAIWDFWTGVAAQDMQNQSLYLAANRQFAPLLFPDAPTKPRSVPYRAVRKLYQITRETLSPRSVAPRQPRVICRYDALKDVQHLACDLVERAKDPLDQVLNTPYILQTLSTLDQNKPSESECAVLIRIINVAHIITAITGEH